MEMAISQWLMFSDWLTSILNNGRKDLDFRTATNPVGLIADLGYNGGGLSSRHHFLSFGVNNYFFVLFFVIH